MRNRYFSCYLKVAFLLQNQESLFLLNFLAQQAVPVVVSWCFCIFSIFSNFLGSGAIPSFEMEYPKKLTLSTGFELDIFSLIVKQFFTLSILDCKHSLVELLLGSSIDQHIVLTNHSTSDSFECSFDAILEES